MATEFAKRASQRFADRLDRVVLFGSVARGTDRPDSDVDVLVVIRVPGAGLRDELDALAFALTLETGRTPALVLYPSTTWAHARASGSELVAAVEREGVTLWTRNGEHSSLPA